MAPTAPEWKRGCMHTHAFLKPRGAPPQGDQGTLQMQQRDDGKVIVVIWLADQVLKFPQINAVNGRCSGRRDTLLEETIKAL